MQFPNVLALSIICRNGEEYPLFAKAVQHFNNRVKENLENKCRNLRELHGCVQGVGVQLFCDGIINWWRIVALYCFGVHLANRFTDNKEQIANEIGNFVSINLNCWISCHGGWIWI